MIFCSVAEQKILKITSFSLFLSYLIAVLEDKGEFSFRVEDIVEGHDILMLQLLKRRNQGV